MANLINGKLLEKIIQNSFYRKHRELLLMTTDLLMVAFCYCVAALFKNNFIIENVFSVGKNYMLFMLLVFAIHIITFGIFNVHQSLWKYFGLKEVFNVTLSILTATAIIVIVAFSLNLGASLAAIVIIAEVFALIGVLNIRFLYRVYRDRIIMNKAGTKRAVIIGAGDGGYILLKELRQNKSMVVDVVGFVDDYKTKKIVSGVKVLGTTKDLKKIKEKYKVQVAYIAMPGVQVSERKRIYDRCQEAKLEIKIMKDGNHLIKLGKGEMKYPVEDVSIEDLLGRGEINLNQNQVYDYLGDKVIVVTGAGGSIGSELCRQIIKYRPRRLVMIDINENSLYMLEHELKRNNAALFTSTDLTIISNIASIREKHEIDAIFRKENPDVVFHAAAHKHVPLMETRPQEAFKNNVLGSNNVMLSSIEHKVSYFVLISTDKAVNPTNVMGATKRMTEMLVQAYGNNGVTKMAAVRFGNVLGSNGSVIPIFNEQIKNGGPITLTHRDIIRYFMTIPEASQLVLQAGAFAKNGEIFVLDMGEPVRIIDLAEKLIRLSGYEPYEEIDIIEVGLRPGEKMFEELKLSNEEVDKTTNNLIFVNHPIQIDLNVLKDHIKEIESLVKKESSPKILKEAILKAIN